MRHACIREAGLASSGLVHVPVTHVPVTSGQHDRAGAACMHLARVHLRGPSKVAHDNRDMHIIVFHACISKAAGEGERAAKGVPRVRGLDLGPASAEHLRRCSSHSTQPLTVLSCGIGSVYAYAPMHARRTHSDTRANAHRAGPPYLGPAPAPGRRPPRPAAGDDRLCLGRADGLGGERAPAQALDLH